MCSSNNAKESGMGICRFNISCAIQICCTVKIYHISHCTIFRLTPDSCSARYPPLQPQSIRSPPLPRNRAVRDHAVMLTTSLQEPNLSFQSTAERHGSGLLISDPGLLFIFQHAVRTKGYKKRPGVSKQSLQLEFSLHSAAEGRAGTKIPRMLNLCRGHFGVLLTLADMNQWCARCVGTP